MTRPDIIREVAKDTGYVSEGVKKVLESFFEVVKRNAINGEKININGFMNIETEIIPPVKKYHMHRHEVIEFPERKKIVATISPTWQITEPVK